MHLRKKRARKKVIKTGSRYLKALEDSQKLSYYSNAEFYRRKTRNNFAKAYSKYAKKYGEDSIDVKGSGKTSKGKAYMNISFKNHGIANVKASKISQNDIDIAKTLVGTTLATSGFLGVAMLKLSVKN